MIWWVVVLLAAVVVWLMIKLVQESRRFEHELETGRSVPWLPSARRRYWGKQLAAGMNACVPAKAQDGQRYKLGHEPALPLSGCHDQHCQCWFDYLPERRTGEDRRFGLERRELFRVNRHPNRRHGPDRRHGSGTDHLSAA